MASHPVLRAGQRALHAVAGEHSTLERYLVRRYAKARKAGVDKHVGATFVQYTGERYTLIQSRADPEPRVGVYMRGGCDLPSLFAAASLLRQNPRGSCCIFNDGSGISDARADILLQGLRGIPADQVETVVTNLKLSPDYFSSRLIEQTFAIPEGAHLGSFPKTVVVLSAAPNLVRTAYRHRELGYVVDPGGWWLNQDMKDVLSDLSTAKWFNTHFESIGRITIEQFSHDFGEVVRLVKERTGAHVLVYNALVVEPGNPTHNYQFVKSAQSMRGRALHLALTELSAELDFHIVDVDRVLKTAGVKGQMDFAHFASDHSKPIAAEAYRILRDLEVVA